MAEEHAISTEESDHLERSTKKIKGSDGGASINGAHVQEKRSFRHTLMWGRKDAVGIEEMGNIEKIAIDLNADLMVESDAEEEFEDDSMPRVKFSTDLRQALQRPWLTTLIVKLLGKTLSFTTFEARVTKLWAPTGELDFIDLGLGYYVIKFQCNDDVMKVLTGGPWKIMDHYLHVQRWKPNFRPSTATLGPTAVWIRLPELPLEYFHADALLEIGSKIGKPLKLDANTSLAARGKFTRICVEVDLSKPLIPRVRIGNLVQVIEYEAMHVVCFECGLFGRRMNNCPQTKVAGKVAEKEHDHTSSPPVESLVSKEKTPENFGPWMLVQRRSRIYSQRGKEMAKNAEELPKNGEEMKGNMFHALNDDAHVSDVAGVDSGEEITAMNVEGIVATSPIAYAGPGAMDKVEKKVKGNRVKKVDSGGDTSNGPRLKPAATGPEPKLGMSTQSKSILKRSEPLVKPTTKGHVSSKGLIKGPLPSKLSSSRPPESKPLEAPNSENMAHGSNTTTFSHFSDPPESRMAVSDAVWIANPMAEPSEYVDSGQSSIPWRSKPASMDCNLDLTAIGEVQAMELGSLSGKGSEKIGAPCTDGTDYR